MHLLRLFHELVHHIAPSVRQHQRVLKLLLNLIVRQLFALAIRWANGTFLIDLLLFVLDHVVEKLQVWHVELAHLLENLFDVQVAQLRQVLVQVLWNGLTRWLYDCVPLHAVEVIW